MAAEIGVRALPRRDDVDQGLRVEHVVAHRCQAALVVARHRRRFLDLLVEVEDPTVGVGLDHAELASLVLGHGYRRDGDAGTDVAVVVDELARIHPVDVVGAEHADEIGVLVGDQVEVLVDRVGGSREPERTAAHLRRHRRHVLAEQRREAPGLADVAVEAVALVLGEHDHLEQTGVGEVGQGEVDQPVAAGERHGRLGPVVGEWLESLALAASKDDYQDPRFGHTPKLARRSSETFVQLDVVPGRIPSTTSPDASRDRSGRCGRERWRDGARPETGPT